MTYHYKRLRRRKLLNWLPLALDNPGGPPLLPVNQDSPREADKWAHARSFPESSCDTPSPDRSHSLNLNL